MLKKADWSESGDNTIVNPWMNGMKSYRKQILLQLTRPWKNKIFSTMVTQMLAKPQCEPNRQ